MTKQVSVFRLVWITIEMEKLLISQKRLKLGIGNVFVLNLMFFYYSLSPSLFNQQISNYSLFLPLVSYV